VKEDKSRPVMVSRRIGAPAADVFRILANPHLHPHMDGSGMLRGAVSGATISGVGDVFVMKMYYSELGHYEMNNHVVEYEPDRRIGWEPEAGRGHPGAGGSWGQRWSFELTPDGPDATIVTEIYDCSRAPDEERADMDNGAVWIESMTGPWSGSTLCPPGRSSRRRASHRDLGEALGQPGQLEASSGHEAPPAA
jgi:uncharacterized protein YndB with AHSA1/START domain